jgi:hypothetical protein
LPAKPVLVEDIEHLRAVLLGLDGKMRSILGPQTLFQYGQMQLDAGRLVHIGKKLGHAVVITGIGGKLPLIDGGKEGLGIRLDITRGRKERT